MLEKKKCSNNERAKHGMKQGELILLTLKC